MTDNQNKPHNRRPFEIPGSFFKSEKREWMAEQEKKNRDPSSGYWLWDHEAIQEFILSELKKDGIDEADMKYASWLAMRMKFLKEPFLSFTKKYFQTKERKYMEVLNGKHVYEWMRLSEKSYIHGILYGDEKIAREIDFNEESLGYDKEFRSSKPIRFLIPTADGTDIREMTTEEKYVLEHESILGTEEYRRIERIGRDEFDRIFPELLGRFEIMDEKRFEELWKRKEESGKKPKSMMDMFLSPVQTKHRYEIGEEEKETYTAFPAVYLPEVMRMLNRLGVVDYTIMKYHEIPEGEDCYYQNENHFFAYSEIRSVKSGLCKKDILEVVADMNRIDFDSTEFVLKSAL